MSFRKAVGTMVFGNATAQMIGAAGSVILARLYSPADFGVFASILAVATIIGNVASLRYDLSVLMAGTPASARFAATLALGIAGLSVTIAALVMMAASAFGLLEIRFVFSIVLIASGIAIINVSRFTQSRNRRFRRQALIGLARPIGFLLFGVFFHYSPISANGLVDASSLSLFVVGVGLLLLEYRRYPWRRLMTKKRAVKLWIKKHHELPIYAAPAVFMNTAAVATQTVLLLWLFGPVLAGLFAMTTRTVDMPTTVISGAVNVVYQREVAERKNNQQRILPLTVKAFTAMSGLAFGILAALVGAVWLGLFDLVFSSEWENLGLMVLIASPMVLTRFVARSVSGFGVLGYSKLGLVFQTSQLLVVVCALFTAYLMSATDFQAVATLTWSLAAIGLIQIAAVFIVVRRIDKNHIPRCKS